MSHASMAPRAGRSTIGASRYVQATWCCPRAWRPCRSSRNWWWSMTARWMRRRLSPDRNLRSRGKDADVRLAARREQAAPIIAALKPWLEAQLSRIPQKSQLAEDIRYTLAHWPGLIRFLDDGKLELDTNPVENQIRPIAKRVSLCTPSSSVCKHWKCIRISNATRARRSGYRSFDRLRRQVVGTDLIRRTGHHLHSRKDAGFHKAPYRVVCDA
jgi:transposase